MTRHLLVLLGWMAWGGGTGALWIAPVLTGVAFNPWQDLLWVGTGVAWFVSWFIGRAAIDAALGPWPDRRMSPGTRFDLWLLACLTDPAFEDARARARGRQLQRRLVSAPRSASKRPRL